LNLLLLLDTILYENSVTRAAAKLGLSQSATSNALRRLRDHFNDNLVVNSGRGMVPTRLAREIAGEIRQLVQEAQILSRARSVFDPLISTKKLTISVSDFSSSILLSHLLRRLRVSAPRMHVDIVGMLPYPSRSLDRGEIDAVVIARGFMPKNYPSQFLFEDRYVCVAWGGSTLATRELTLEEYRSRAHAVHRSPNFVLPDIVEPIIGEPRHVALTAPYFLLLPRMIVGTEYLATIPFRLAARSAGTLPLLIRPLPFPTSPVLSLVFWHPTKGEDPARVWFRSLMDEIAADLKGDLLLLQKTYPIETKVVQVSQGAFARASIA
jgi:DNA-binding transcriptional LysR family regulator